MKEFKTLQDIHAEREALRSNKVLYTLLGVLIGELDRLPTRNAPSADDIYKQIVKLYNNAKEMSQYKQASMEEFEYLNENRSDCITTLQDVIAKRIGKSVEITVRKNENGRSAKESVPDLRDLIQFEIEEENF